MAHERDETTELVSRARTDPSAVAVGDAVLTLSTPGAVDRDGLVGAVAAVVSANPDARDNAADGLATALAHDDPDVRSAAATVVGSVSENDPALLYETIPALVRLLDDEALLPRINATHALSMLAPHAPESVAEGVPTLGNRLDSEFPNMRELAARCLHSLTQAEPALVAPAVPDLLALVAPEPSETRTDPTTDGALGERDQPAASAPAREYAAEAQNRRLRLRSTAAETIAMVAREEPSAVSLDERLIEAVGSDVAEPVRRWAVVAVAALVQAGGGHRLSVVDPLARVVDDGSAPFASRGMAAEALAHCAEEEFEATTDATRSLVPELDELLCTDDAGTRAGSVALLTYLAERFPDETSDATPTLRAALDAESESVRARSAFALGFVAEEEDRERLRLLRENDPSEAVRGAAATALDSTER